jgi:hypothetical protein
VANVGALIDATILMLFIALGVVTAFVVRSMFVLAFGKPIEPPRLEIGSGAIAAVLWLFARSVWASEASVFDTAPAILLLNALHFHPIFYVSLLCAMITVMRILLSWASTLLKDQISRI